MTTSSLFMLASHEMGHWQLIPCPHQSMMLAGEGPHCCLPHTRRHAYWRGQWGSFLVAAHGRATGPWGKVLRSFCQAQCLGLLTLRPSTYKPCLLLLHCLFSPTKQTNTPCPLPRIKWLQKVCYCYLALVAYNLSTEAKVTCVTSQIGLHC